MKKSSNFVIQVYFLRFEQVAVRFQNENDTKEYR